MSYDLMVYLQRSSMPAPSLWKKAISDAGFAVALDDDFDVFSFVGFLPCSVDGEPAGFEYYVAPTSSEDFSELALAPEFDFSVQFCIGPQPLELTAALAASSVLASMSGGVLVDPQEGDIIAGRDAIEWANSQVQ
ncbi:hypothetical protein HUX88_02970 [Duganella sp. BJB1802]|uniref:hypothetical protein n=1 Tax=Duganella sp. BJB1802 TaxID=2744575 RepID=UPI001592DA77|nr:hypothetical protein [Duganella sp. BJB1802]NVD69519.1 hypothetical protein [Duganella sp. BJB1802]